jgi:Tat protein secretion system quality control protein TatD with DNase activity
VHQWLDPSIPATIYFSFSMAVNAASESAREKLRAVVKEVPEAKILVESDLHVAGEEMDQALAEMYRFVCEVKGWELEAGVKRIADNFEAFIFG